MNDQRDKLCDLWRLLDALPCSTVIDIPNIPRVLARNPSGSEGNQLIPLPLLIWKSPLDTCWVQAKSHTHTVYTHMHNHLLLHLNMALGSLSVILRMERRPLGHNRVCVWVRSGVLPHGGRPWSLRLAWRLQLGLKEHEIENERRCCPSLAPCQQHRQKIENEICGDFLRLFYFQSSNK